MQRRDEAGVEAAAIAGLVSFEGKRVLDVIASHDLPLVVPNCVAFLVMGCTPETCPKS